MRSMMAIARSDEVIFSTIVENDPSADAERGQQAHPFENTHRPVKAGRIVDWFQGTKWKFHEHPPIRRDAIWDSRDSNLPITVKSLLCALIHQEGRPIH
jgi:hypothetical protein